MGLSKSSGEVPRRMLGRTGVEVSALALGGSHIGETKSKREASRIVHEAIDSGIDFMDNAWEYHDGLSEELMGEALEGRRHGVFLRSKVCTHGRDRQTAMRQLEPARREGKVRFVGFTGHKDPAIHLKMLAHAYPFDTCQFPLNPFDATFRSFEQQVLPEVLRQGIAPLGMKSLGGGGDAIKS